MEIKEPKYGGFAKVTVLKRGQVYTAFIDENSRPVYFTNPESAPTDCMALTASSKEEMQMKFPGAEIIPIDAHKPNTSFVTGLSPAAKKELNKMVQSIPEDERSKIKGLDRDYTVKTLPHKIESKPPNPTTVIHGAVETQDEILGYVKTKMAQYSVASGKKKTDLKKEIEAIGEMVITLWPELVDDLSRMRDSLSEPKFTLD